MRFGAVETPLRQLVAQVACVDAGRGGRPATAASAPRPRQVSGRRRLAPPPLGGLAPGCSGEVAAARSGAEWQPGAATVGKQVRGREVVCGWKGNVPLSFAILFSSPPNPLPLGAQARGKKARGKMGREKGESRAEKHLSLRWRRLFGRRAEDLPKPGGVAVGLRRPRTRGGGAGGGSPLSLPPLSILPSLVLPLPVGPSLLVSLL